MIATSTSLAINKTLYRKLPYDPVKDFTAIALVAAVPFALIVNPQLPVKSLADFIAYARSNPGLAYGSAREGHPPPLRAPAHRRRQGEGARRDHAEAGRRRARYSDTGGGRPSRLRAGGLAGHRGAR